MTEVPVPVSSRSKKLWNAIKIILAVILIAFVISRTDLKELVRLWHLLSRSWLLLSVACFVLMTVVKAFQYRALIDPGLSIWNVLNIIVMQNAISNFISNAAGVVSYMSMFRTEHGVKLSRSAVAFIIVKVSDLTAILILLVSSMAIVWNEVAVLHSILLLLAGGILFGLLVFLATIFFREYFIAQLHKFLEWSGLFRFAIIRSGYATLESLSKQDQGIVLAMLRRGFLFSSLYFACTITWSYTLIRAFHIPVGFAAMVFVSAVRQLISLIPIQVFGGLGVTEISSLYLYGLFGPPLAELSAALLGIRLYNTLLNALSLVYIPFGRTKS